MTLTLNLLFDAQMKITVSNQFYVSNYRRVLNVDIPYDIR